MRWFNLFRKNNIENAVIDNPFRIQLREKHEGQIGYVVSIPRVRILYPRGKNRGDICVADLFSIILWDTIDENYDVRVSVGLSLNKGLKEFKEFIHKTIRPYILS